MLLQLFCVVGCNEREEPIVGEWLSAKGESLVFRSDKTFMIRLCDELQNGTYEIDYKRFPHHIDLTYAGTSTKKVGIFTFLAKDKSGIKLALGKNRRQVFLEAGDPEYFLVPFQNKSDTIQVKQTQ
jgi:hypothetical protein